MSERRKPVDQSHVSLAMFAAAQTGRPYEELLYYPDAELFGMIALPDAIESLGPFDLYTSGKAGQDGKPFPHRRDTAGRDK